MSFALYLLIFISGLFVGSFLNLVSDRILTGEQILKGHSHCDFCKRPLSAKNLIPLLSYFFQRGKCLTCGKKISVIYPISEFLSGLIFVLAAYKSDLFITWSAGSLIFFLYLVITLSFFLILFLTDIKKMLIPNKVVYPAIIFVFLTNLVFMIYAVYSLYAELNSYTLGKYLIEAGFFRTHAVIILKQYGMTFFTAALIGLFFWSLVTVTKGRGMGGGDIKLGFLIGLFNVFPQNILAIFLAYVIGATYSVSLIALKRKTLKDIVPFGPFLIVGSMIAFLFGQTILDWYFGLMI